MKKPFLNVRCLGVGIMSVLVVSLASCNKDDILDDVLNNDDPAQATPPPFPSVANSDGTLVAIRSQTTQSTPIGPMTTTLGLGVAVFYESAGSTTFLDAGTVELNELALTKQTNNTYAFQPSADNASGIDFTGGSSWNVSGATDVTAFTFTPTISFPSLDAVSSGETVSKSNGYTLTTTGVIGADSVIFQVGTVLKTVAGNATSCTFSAADLTGLSTGTSIVQIAAYKIQNETVTSKNYYFINESVVTKTVTVE